jgi:archaellum component FlaF (FlaF/FlaG flagellin family)
MKTRSLRPIGALHPVLFFTGVYFVVLLVSIFICSAIFYSCNSSANAGIGKIKQQKQKPAQTEQVAQSQAIAKR